MSDIKLYRVAEICYNPSSSETPWYIMRAGTVVEQGGLGLGTESISFKTVQDACNYLSKAIADDVDVIVEQINKKEMG